MVEQIELGKWISLGIIIFIMIISLIVELTSPATFGTTTIVSLIPSAFVAGFVEFRWWLPLLELGMAIVLWVLIYCLMYKVFKINLKGKKQMDFIDTLKNFETTLIENTCNFEGRQEFGEIRIDDKQYLVLPADDHTWIEKNSLIRIVSVKGNICYVRKV
ncbi:MAG: hypothetical protein K2I67_01240 [Malacoplasma sp.]|nr:hypothetical protein [Malacoplasma sp.]